MIEKRAYYKKQADYYRDLGNAALNRNDPAEAEKCFIESNNWQTALTNELKVQS